MNAARIAAIRAYLDDENRTALGLDEIVEELLTDVERQSATVERVRGFAADMRDWCSPHGISADYADRLEQTINRT